MIKFEDLSAERQRNLEYTRDELARIGVVRSLGWMMAGVNCYNTLEDWEKWGFNLFKKDWFIKKVDRAYKETEPEPIGDDRLEEVIKDIDNIRSILTL